MLEMSIKYQVNTSPQVVSAFKCMGNTFRVDFRMRPASLHVGFGTIPHTT